MELLLTNDDGLEADGLREVTMIRRVSPPGEGGCLDSRGGQCTLPGGWFVNERRR